MFSNNNHSNVFSQDVVVNVLSYFIYHVDFDESYFLKLLNSLTSESIPNKSTIKKNRNAHNCGIGICATASGYAMNANPGPGEKKNKT